MAPPNPPLSLVGPGTTGPAPPRALGPPGLALWNRVQAEYRILDSGGTEILCLAAPALDRAERLLAAIAAGGAKGLTRARPPAPPALPGQIAKPAARARPLGQT